MFKQTITFDSFIRALTGIVITLLAYILLTRLSHVLIPFFVAWLVAYMLYPFIHLLETKCHIKSRVLNIIIVLVVLLSMLSLACYLIIPPVIEECGRVKDIIVDYVSGSRTTTAITAEIESYVKHNINLDEISNALTIKDVSSFLEKRIPQIFHLISNGVGAVLGIFGFLISIIYLFFILLDYEQIADGFINLVPRSKRPFVSTLISDVQKGMNGYFRGQTAIAFIDGILFAIGFVIIGIPLAIPLGLFVGLMVLVPYLHTLGIIPAVVLALLKAHDSGSNFWFLLIAILAVFLIVQLIQDMILTPRIMGNVTGLNPAVIFLSLSVWGSLLGFIGLIIALPLTSLLTAYYKRYVLEENHEESNS